MAQRKLHEKVETYIVVSIIAVLVWLYAEATVLQEKSGLSVQLRITEATEGYAITPDAATVRVSFRASSGQIQQFNLATSLPLVHEIDTTGITTKTERTLILDEVLIRAGLGDIGITDLTVEPATINLTLQPLRKVEMAVVVDHEGLNLNGEPRPEPAFITVTAPEEMADALRNQAVVARLDATNAGDGTGPERFASNVSLTFPEALDLRSPWVTADVRSVGINFTVDNNTATVIVPLVPLYINLPVNTQLEYTVRLQDRDSVLRDVELQGPPDIIGRISAKDPDLMKGIRAELTITDIDRIEQTTVERPVIITPPGVTAQTPEAMPITVRRRDAPTGN